MADLAKKFGTASAAEIQPFLAYLERVFEDRDTVREVAKALDNMGLPLPENYQQFLAGTEGALIFLNRYGVVLRIEREKHNEDNDLGVGEMNFERFDNNPWVLKPLGTITAGKAVIEICPGCNPEKNINQSNIVKGLLRREGIYFWDDGVRNMGRVPVKTPSFPEGIPVVVDRLAVRRLTIQTNPISRALDRLTGKQARDEKLAREAAATEQKLYGTLQESFAASTGDKKKMKDFWTLCAAAVKEGTLVAGWMQNAPWGTGKGNAALQTGQAYEMRLRIRDMKAHVRPASKAAPT